MSVRSAGGRIVLEGRCRVEDAEKLLAELQRAPQSIIDVSSVEVFHTAVIQILLAARPKIEGTIADAFVARFVFGPEPAYTASADTDANWDADRYS